MLSPTEICDNNNKKIFYFLFNNDHPDVRSSRRRRRLSLRCILLMNKKEDFLTYIFIWSFSSLAKRKNVYESFFTISGYFFLLSCGEREKWMNDWQDGVTWSNLNDFNPSQFSFETNFSTGGDEKGSNAP